jgi:predicted deacetylase
LLTRNAEPRERLAAIGLHDVSPATWPACERLVELVRSFGADIPITLLVVPAMHRRAAIDEAPAWRPLVDRVLAGGGEIALHGLWHLDDGGPSPSLGALFARRLLTAGEAEFAALDAPTARARIEKGLAMLRRCSWQAAGFVPPAWQISAAASGVLAEFGFGYTTTAGTVTSLPSGTRWSVPCLGFSARSALRRALSRLWIRRQVRRLAGVPALRIALHPIDAQYESTFESWREFLAAVLGDRRPVTKSALCSALARG